MTSILRYANQGAIRNQPLVPGLASNLERAVTAVYGPGAYLQVYSGGQPGKGEDGARTGSIRHDHGRAADIRVFGADGKQISGDGLAPLGQFWRANNLGGVGMEMHGGGIHLDDWTKPPPGGGMNWNYANQGGTYTDAMASAIAAGNKGVMPTLFGGETPSPTTMTAGASDALQNTGDAPTMAYNAQQKPSPAFAAIDQQTTGSTQPAMASAAPEPKKRSGLFGGLIGEGGLIDPTSEQFLLAATLIANGMKPPGQMMDGIPEALLAGRRMSDAREQKAKDEKILNETTRWLRERDPDLASLVENRILPGGDAVTQFYARQKEAKEEQTWRDRVKYQAEVQQSDPKYQLDLQNARTEADQRNQTAQWLNDNEPEIGSLVKAGMPVADGYKLAYEKRYPKPDRQWVQLQNGDFGWADKKSGQFEKLGSAPKVGGDNGAELPAEMGARIGLGDKFLAQVPAIRKRIENGDASGLWDKTMLATGSGGAGQLWRQIETGRDALVRNLTGAGMPESEAQNQAARYQIGVTDSVETMLDKLTNLEADLRATRSGAIGAKTGKLSLTPAPGSGSDPAGALDEARTAIAKGAPREAIIQRLTQMGISPEGL
ncbi:hypothetical protein P7F60_18395 [Rhizobium sp. YJ-22]|uniref:hypothetical protein n=2 Tax=Rhizobium TaxID=379 RepID=UPI0024123112|nr:hypothetical protein [Rhizobium sp. YJ-22]MDG3578370.1 hypothetical protein [Rhizobium sp. YJ-22]